jgi:hypothetical protein
MHAEPCETRVINVIETASAYNCIVTSSLDSIRAVVSFDRVFKTQINVGSTHVIPKHTELMDDVSFSLILFFASFC